MLDDHARVEISRDAGCLIKGYLDIFIWYATKAFRINVETVTRGKSGHFMGEMDVQPTEEITKRLWRLAVMDHILHQPILDTKTDFLNAVF